MKRLITLFIAILFLKISIGQTTKVVTNKMASIPATSEDLPKNWIDEKCVFYVKKGFFSAELDGGLVTWKIIDFQTSPDGNLLMYNILDVEDSQGMVLLYLAEDGSATIRMSFQGQKDAFWYYAPAENITELEDK